MHSNIFSKYSNFKKIIFPVAVSDGFFYQGKIFKTIVWMETTDIHEKNADFF